MLVLVVAVYYVVSTVVAVLDVSTVVTVLGVSTVVRPFYSRSACCPKRCVASLEFIATVFLLLTDKNTRNSTHAGQIFLTQYPFQEQPPSFQFGLFGPKGAAIVPALFHQICAMDLNL